MPVYEYRCHRGHQYELVQGFDAPSEHACPHCGELASRRFSSPAVIFKGSGFYSTDNRKSSTFGGGNSNGGSADSAASTDATGTTASGGESKAETGTEAKAAD